MKEKPWNLPMSEKDFALMRRILGAPSPVGFEAAMTQSVIAPYMRSWMPEGWALREFVGNAGIVLDTHPGRDDMFSAMVIGHADKIRMQVRSIAEDGKIWINSDSFLPMTLLGNEVLLFSVDPDTGKYRPLRGTIEAIGAIHFSPQDMRTGAKGIGPEKVYLELLAYGDNPKAQVEALGVRQGDPIILDRPIRPGTFPNTFTGAYLDNGLGCFVTAQVMHMLATVSNPSIRVLGACAAYEEIGRFGSRVMAGEMKPDVIIGVDVAHDYRAAPGRKDKHDPDLHMGGGFTLSRGSIANTTLNNVFMDVAREHGIPIQHSPVGRDTGTDAMAAVLAAVDAAATSIGFPIRNMHTASEAGHTGDVLAATYAIYQVVETLAAMNDGKGVTRDFFKSGHTDLSRQD